MQYRRGTQKRLNKNHNNSLENSSPGFARVRGFFYPARVSYRVLFALPPISSSRTRIRPALRSVTEDSNATSYEAAQPFAGAPKWLSAFDLDKLTAGASRFFEKIGSATMGLAVASVTVHGARYSADRQKLVGK
jgi:hypothetical protein